MYYLRKKDPIRDIIERLLCLPYLPSDRIAPVFAHIRNLAPVDVPELNQFFDYIDRTWINGQWDPSSWSVYNKAIRTNNDCKGLHNRWNKRGKGRKSYYWILSILAKEANRIERTAQQLAYGINVRERSSLHKKRRSPFYLLDGVWGGEKQFLRTGGEVRHTPEKEIPVLFFGR